MYVRPTKELLDTMEQKAMRMYDKATSFEIERNYWRERAIRNEVLVNILPWIFNVILIVYMTALLLLNR